MSLYDNVSIEFDLPDELKEIAEWQTKDFDHPFLNKYVITKTGRLLKEKVHYEDRSDPNATGIMALVGALSAVHDGWEDMNYHGMLNFHGLDKNNKYISCEAKFTDGECIEIKKVEE